MKVLYFGDPLIGADRKDFIGGIVDCSTGFFNALRSHDESQYTFKIISNEFTENRLVDYSENVVVHSNYFTEKLNIENRYELLGKWFSGTYSTDLLDIFTEYYAELLKGYTPDVIFTLSPVPYLRKIFPEALVLHHEASMFTRFPFEVSLFLDPIGLFHNSFYEMYPDKIKGLELSPKQQHLVDQLKFYYKLLLMVNNPYKNIMTDLRKSFEKIILIPFQVSQYYQYDPRITEKDPLSLLKNILDEIDPGIGVIVTFHPSENILEGYELELIKQHYPNLIYSDEIQYEKTSSNYLIPFVDAVGCVSSKVGLQTSILENKLLALGACFHGIADELNIAGLPEMFDKQSTETDSLIYWMAAKYAVNTKYIFSENWLPAFVEKSLGKFRSNSINADFYDDIDDPELQLTDLINQIRNNIPSKIKKSVMQHEHDIVRNILPDAEFENIARALNDKRNKMLSFVESNTANLIQKAEELIELGDYDNAREALQTILEYDSNNIAALNDLSVVSILQNDFDNAEVLIDRVLENEPDNEIALGNHRFILENLNKIIR